MIHRHPAEQPLGTTQLAARRLAWIGLTMLTVAAVIAWAWTAAHASTASHAAAVAPTTAGAHTTVVTVDPQAAPPAPVAAAAAVAAGSTTAPQPSWAAPLTAAQAPTPAATAPPAARATAASAPRNLLVSADGTLRIGVGVYTDCTGQTALTRVEAAIDTCITDATYFDGHNPGVFTPLMHMGVGSVITWYDGDGTAHPFRVVAVRRWLRADGAPPLAATGVVAQFQTCWTLDGSVDRILDAVAA